MNDITVRSVVEFILANRRGKAFLDWTEREVVYAVLDAIEDKTLGVCRTESGEITGVVHGTVDKEKKIYYVYNILALPRRGVLRRLMELHEKLYNGYTIQARRKDKLVTYNTPRLAKLVTVIV